MECTVTLIPNFLICTGHNLVAMVVMLCVLAGRQQPRCSCAATASSCRAPAPTCQRAAHRVLLASHKTLAAEPQMRIPAFRNLLTAKLGSD